MNNETFHSEEFFVERMLDGEGKLKLVSQRKPVDFDQFLGAVNLDEYPGLNESEKIIEDNIYFIPEFKKPKKSKSKKLYIAKSSFYY
jgi:hypothetical protein